MSQWVSVKAQVVQALAPAGWLETLLQLIAGGTLRRRQVGRLCVLAAREPLMVEAFDLTSNDPAVWEATAERLLRRANAAFAAATEEEGRAARVRREAVAIAENRASNSRRLAAAASRAVVEAERRGKGRLEALEAKLEEQRLERERLITLYEQLRSTAVGEFAIPEERCRRPVLPTVADFDALLDVTWRHELFAKALRYWEGRWILETQRLLSGPPDRQRARQKAEERFRRWCMLTPCLIVTLHTLTPTACAPVWPIFGRRGSRGRRTV